MATFALGLCATATVCTACDDDPKRPVAGRQRSDSIVAAKPSATSSATPPKASAKPSTTKKRRQLCTSRPDGVETPKAMIGTAAAAGAGDLPNPIPFGAGKWIWVNLWAAWCKPCIAEMPRLRQWHRELRKDGVLIDLAFVSLDDDERQLRRFLDKESKDGMRVSYWLREDQREGWLKPFKVSAEAELPVHILVDPKGEVRSTE